jgi:hypothetical protein
MSGIARLADVLREKLRREYELYRSASAACGPFDTSMDTDEEIREKQRRADLHNCRIDCFNEVLRDLNASAIHPFTEPAKEIGK